MAKIHRPRHGSLQFWPRKRAEKMLPSVNWKPITARNSDKKSLLGFIAYKVGMKSAFVKDITPNSMTKDKKVIIPVTILEVPPMKILSIRAYKDGKVRTEVLAHNLDKELKRKVRMPKAKSSKLEELEKNIGSYNKITIVAYSLVGKTGIKKAPDISEIAIGGANAGEQFAFAKVHFDKEMKATEVLKDIKLMDVRGVTIGKGFTGPVKRYGLELRQHKSEKGRRRPGSLAPWHPARTTYMSPNAGQMGLFTRAVYNNQVLMLNDTEKFKINPNEGFKNYGVIKNEFIILRGSVQGPSKRAVIITAPLRKTKKQEKKKFEFIELR